MAAVSLLAPPPSVSHASTMIELLGLLDLLSLEPKFRQYNLKKLTSLWDIELSSVSCGGVVNSVGVSLVIGGVVSGQGLVCPYLLGVVGGCGYR